MRKVNSVNEKKNKSWKSEFIKVASERAEPSFKFFYGNVYNNSVNFEWGTTFGIFLKKNPLLSFTEPTHGVRK